MTNKHEQQKPNILSQNADRMPLKEINNNAQTSGIHNKENSYPLGVLPGTNPICNTFNIASAQKGNPLPNSSKIGLGSNAADLPSSGASSNLASMQSASYMNQVTICTSAHQCDSAPARASHLTKKSSEEKLSFSGVLVDFSRALADFSGVLVDFSRASADFSRALVYFSGVLVYFSRVLADFSGLSADFSCSLMEFSCILV